MAIALSSKDNLPGARSSTFSGSKLENKLWINQRYIESVMNIILSYFFMIRKTIYLDRVRDLRVAGDRDRRADLDLKIDVFFTSDI